MDISKRHLLHQAETLIKRSRMISFIFLTFLEIYQIFEVRLTFTSDLNNKSLTQIITE